MDTFAVQDPVSMFSRVLAGLRSKVRFKFDQGYTCSIIYPKWMSQSATFADIVHWYDPSSLQSFIVNSRILRVFARTLLEDNAAVVTYVLLDASPTLVSM